MIESQATIFLQQTPRSSHYPSQAFLYNIILRVVFQASLFESFFAITKLLYAQSFVSHAMTCIQFRGFISKVRSNCLQGLGLNKKSSKDIQSLDIVRLVTICFWGKSWPFRVILLTSNMDRLLISQALQSASMSPYTLSQCENSANGIQSISLLKEKAIASTAIVDDEFDEKNPRSACFERYNLSSIKTMCPVMRATRRYWD